MIEHTADKPPIPIAFLAVLAVALLFILFNIYVLVVAPMMLQTAPTATSAADVTPVLLVADNCTECFPLDVVAKRVLPGFRTVQLSTQEGSGLAAKYSISKLPALIVSNFTPIANQALLQQFASRGDAFVLESPSPPFFEVSTGRIKGKISAVAITPLNCSECTNATDALDQLKSNAFIDARIIAEGNPTAQALIAKYNLPFLPAFIFSPDLLEYPQFKDAWTTLGSVEADGQLVMRQPVPPYKNLSTNATDGLVSAVYLTDDSCATCYNVSIHKAALSNYDVYVVNESYVDAASLEGAAIIEKYNVTAVPTIILSKEAGSYYALKAAWPGLGSIETDGAFVFRNLDQLPGQVYKDLSNNSLVTTPSVP